ncbi:hypothetical protein PsYK624_114110 [Phanerochaete sordida]|uniref:Uncharacterized protein n=1 Tax=Phanerochaete sordida TaxID=48140 RepID=A0A9P3LI25_9APHY|nr:hypothetical protein PsYK624_114110 [Phanerochaete sordida]
MRARSHKRSISGRVEGSIGLHDSDLARTTNSFTRLVRFSYCQQKYVHLRLSAKIRVYSTVRLRILLDLS